MLLAEFAGWCSRRTIHGKTSRKAGDRVSKHKGDGRSGKQFFHRTNLPSRLGRGKTTDDRLGGKRPADATFCSMRVRGFTRLLQEMTSLTSYDSRNVEEASGFISFGACNWTAAWPFPPLAGVYH